MVELEEEELARAVELRALIDRLDGARCAACGEAMCGHDALNARIFGVGAEARCPRCLALGLGRDELELREQAVSYVGHHPCFSDAWAYASGREVAACFWPRQARAGARAPAAVEGELRFDAQWDAGEMSCGDLVLELKQRLSAMLPRSILQLIARDPGAPADLPAWCGLTGHVLRHAAHPLYLIQRRDD